MPRARQFFQSPDTKPLTAATRALTRDARYCLARAADAEKAGAMQRYMKSEMPYCGVSAVPLRKACKQVFARHPLDTFEEWQGCVLSLWRSAKRREERYAAIELARDRRYRTYLTLKALPMLEEMVVTGAWWDFVDVIATDPLGQLLSRQPSPMKRTMRRWSRSRDLRKRRSAILCQIRAKSHTDLAFLFACIEPSLGRKGSRLRIKASSNSCRRTPNPPERRPPERSPFPGLAAARGTRSPRSWTRSPRSSR